MKRYLLRLVNLIWGLLIFSIGVVLSLDANIGFAPWDVLHSGFANLLHISIGAGIIIIGLIIVAIVLFFHEPIGLGTLANMILVGTFTQIIMMLDIIPTNTSGNITMGSLMMLVGMLFVAYGTYRYVYSGFGAGPRDSLMVIVARKTRWRIGICRYAVETVVIALGLILRGSAGIGTALGIIFISLSVQVVFKVMKFVPHEVKHENFKVTYHKMRFLLKKLIF